MPLSSLPLFRHGRGHSDSFTGVKGRVMQNVDPTPGSDVTAMVPFIASTSCLTIHSPTPKPPA